MVDAFRDIGFGMAGFLQQGQAEGVFLFPDGFLKLGVDFLLREMPEVKIIGQNQ